MPNPHPGKGDNQGSSSALAGNSWSLGKGNPGQTEGGRWRSRRTLIFLEEPLNGLNISWFLPLIQCEISSCAKCCICSQDLNSVRSWSRCRRAVCTMSAHFRIKQNKKLITTAALWSMLQGYKGTPVLRGCWDFLQLNRQVQNGQETVFNHGRK